MLTLVEQKNSQGLYSLINGLEKRSRKNDE